MKKLNHKWIDVIKLDMAYHEIENLKMMLVEGKRRRKRKGLSELPFTQLLFEFHTGGNPHLLTKIMINYMNRQFKIYAREFNLKTFRPWENIRFSMIKLTNNGHIDLGYN